MQSHTGELEGTSRVERLAPGSLAPGRDFLAWPWHLVWQHSCAWQRAGVRGPDLYQHRWAQGGSQDNTLQNKLRRGIIMLGSGPAASQ